MVNDEQLISNLKAAKTTPDSKIMKILKDIFDDLPITQWENLETKWYWEEMSKNGWEQPLDN